MIVWKFLLSILKEQYPLRAIRIPIQDLPIVLGKSKCVTFSTYFDFCLKPRWFQTDFGKNIEINFDRQFSIEAHDEIPCPYDYLKVLI